MKFEYSDKIDEQTQKIEEQTYKIEELIYQVKQDIDEIQQYENRNNNQEKTTHFNDKDFYYSQLVHNDEIRSLKARIQVLFQRSKYLVKVDESNKNKNVLVNKFRKRKQILLRLQRKEGQQDKVMQQIEKWNEFLKNYERTRCYPGKMTIHQRWTFFVLKVYHCQYCFREFKTVFHTKYHIRNNCKKRDFVFAQDEPIMKNKIIKKIFKQF